MTRRVLLSPRPDEPRERESLPEWFRRSIPSWASHIFDQIAWLIKHAPDHEITEAEISAGVTPTNYQYPEGDWRRYGADPLGLADSTTAINAALSINAPNFPYAGTYLANNLVQTHNFQRIEAVGGLVTVKKNANGDLFTSSGDDVQLVGVGFRGDAASPTFTGHNIVASGDNFTLINCGSRWAYARAVLCTGNHLQVHGQCDVYQTADGTDYDIEVGVSGTATLYHQIQNIYTSQNTGGVRFIDCGGQSVVGSQFGKLFIEAGTSPVGVNGGTYASNRINGDVTVEISNSAFASCMFSTVTISLAAGTSGHSIIGTGGATVSDLSTGATIINTSESFTTTYSVTWTAASVNPAIGDGTLSGRYMKLGKLVYVWVKMLAGSTTTFGTGAWSFSLPFVPATFGLQAGSVRVFDSGTNFRTGTALTLSDGTARVQAVIDSETANIDSARPMTWAQNDQLDLSVVYLTN